MFDSNDNVYPFNTKQSDLIKKSDKDDLPRGDNTLRVQGYAAKEQRCARMQLYIRMNIARHLSNKTYSES